jgi:hypothetical protein
MTYYSSGIVRKFGLGLVMATVLLFALDPVAAQGLRDPTLAPKKFVEAGSNSAGLFQGPEPDALTIIVRNGRPHLVIDRLFYAEGEKIGEVLIERITETEVWLRTGGVLRKVSQFPGIQRSTVTP